MAEGHLKPTQRLDGRVTFHDPCYLGRHNGIFDAPRRVLAGIPGLDLVEMVDSRESSLCCGGGGGGAWDTHPIEKRPGALRVRQALDVGADVIVTACPYCARMLDDAVKTLGVDRRIVVQDLAVLLLSSVQTSPETIPVESTSLEVAHV